MAIQTVQVQRKLFTVDEYEQMIRAGVLGEDDRVELIEGEIVEMSPIGGLHMQVVNRLTRLLVQRAADAVIVSVQNPIRLAHSQPQPDLALLRPEVDDRKGAVPRVEDVVLVIEVGDSTAAHDRAVKVPLYARSGIPETWLIDLAEGVVEVYREPAAAGYRRKQTYGAGEAFAPEALPRVRVAVADIFPT